MSRTTKQIKNLIKKLIITKKQGANGKASEELYKSRYGANWKKYYPSVAA